MFKWQVRGCNDARTNAGAVLCTRSPLEKESVLRTKSDRGVGAGCGCEAFDVTGWARRFAGAAVRAIGGNPSPSASHQSLRVAQQRSPAGGRRARKARALLAARLPAKYATTWRVCRPQAIHTQRALALELDEAPEFGQLQHGALLGGPQGLAQRREI